ncbi:High-affinity branched-chain amino acid transport ATP-binding protein LivF [bacterium HR31]|nr:High-affinity branched-chain amino acid transport ATP-binding protein LivF [bacterium HR31]
MLEVHSVTVYYGKALAVEEATLRVGAGEWVALLGPNGAGKTTLLKAVMGLVPYRGSVRLMGQELSGLPAWERVARGLGYAPEGRRVFGRLTVLENLLLAARRLADRERRETLDQVYALFPRLAERARQAAGTLSGGEQQMLSLGRALMARPRVLLIDEASLGLMPRAVRQLFDALARVHAQGTSILMVEQNTRLALRYAQRAYVMETGRVVLEGPADRLAREAALVESYGLQATRP